MFAQVPLIAVAPRILRFAELVSIAGITNINTTVNLVKKRRAFKIGSQAFKISPSLVVVAIYRHFYVLPQPVFWPLRATVEQLMSTQAQVDANRRNAQLSTGPTSESGKAKSSLNAVKTGLTGRTVLLPGDDAALYEAHLTQFIERFKPVGEEEQNLVQSLADTEWRLLRIPSLEMGIYALGRLEFAELFPNEGESVRQQLIEAKIFLTYQRQLNNLGIQENRLRRQREKDSASLRELQENRQRQAKARLDRAAHQYMQAVYQGRHNEWEPEHFGFEFSLGEVEVRALNLKPDLFAKAA